jgi:hypothetical protein
LQRNRISILILQCGYVHVQKRSIRGKCARTDKQQYNGDGNPHDITL